MPRTGSSPSGLLTRPRKSAKSSVEEHDVGAERRRSREPTRRTAVKVLGDVVLGDYLCVLVANEVAGPVVEVGRHVETALAPPTGDSGQALDRAFERQRQEAAGGSVDLTIELHLSATNLVVACERTRGN